MLFVLYSLKTHGKESRPQKIKIPANHESAEGMKRANNLFCPFKLAREYSNLRGDYLTDEENFFVFRDKSPVTQVQVRNVLKQMLKALNVDYTLYNFHSMRIGRATYMLLPGRDKVGRKMEIKCCLQIHPLLKPLSNYLSNYGANYFTEIVLK